MFDLIKTLKVDITTEDQQKESLYMEVKESDFKGKKYALARIKKRNGDFPTWFPYKYNFYETSDNLEELQELFKTILNKWEKWVRPKPICLVILSQKEASEYLTAEKVSRLPIQESMKESEERKAL